MTESDLFFRLAAGREILAHHAIPAHNLFSFTAPDFPDLDASWLFEVGAALLFRRGGFPGVVVAKALVRGGDRRRRVRALPPPRRRAGGVGARASRRRSAVMQERLVERPHIFSFAGEIGALCSRSSGSRAAAERGARRGSRAAGRRRAVGQPARGRLRRAAAAGAVRAGRRDRSPARAARRSRRCWRWRRPRAMLATPLGVGICSLPGAAPDDPAPAPGRRVPRGDAAVRRPRWSRTRRRRVLAAALAWRARRRLAPPAAGGRRSARWRCAPCASAPTSRSCAAPLLAVAPRPCGARAAARALPAACARRAAIAVGALLVALALGPRVAAARAGRPLRRHRSRRSAAAAGRDPVRRGERPARAHVQRLRDRLVPALRGLSRATASSSIPRLPAYPAEFHQLLGRVDLDARRVGSGDGALRRRERAARLRRPQPPRLLVGSRALGAGLPRSTTRASSCAACPLARAHRRARDPGDLLVHRRGGDRDAAARRAARRRRRCRPASGSAGSAICCVELDEGRAGARRRRLPPRAGRAAGCLAPADEAALRRGCRRAGSLGVLNEALVEASAQHLDHRDLRRPSLPVMSWVTNTATRRSKGLRSMPRIFGSPSGGSPGGDVDAIERAQALAAGCRAQDDVVGGLAALGVGRAGAQVEPGRVVGRCSAARTRWR